MKVIYLIRHAKSSWADVKLADFDRPLNKRGQKAAPEMARRLASKLLPPVKIISSPARRARNTAAFIAAGLGIAKTDIEYDEKLYLGSIGYHLALLQRMFEHCDTLCLVGHNPTITELGEFLSGESLGNVPTAGIVAISYGEEGFVADEAQGDLLFFDYPKNKSRDSA